MNFEELSIPGAWKVSSVKHEDHRGSFSEWFKFDEVSLALGFHFEVKQANISFSNRGSVRGIHYSLAPEGQAKWVTCLTGSVLDFIVDIRLGSPTFGKWVAVELSADNNLSLLVSSGLGHAFVAKEDNSCVTYLLTSPYSPQVEFAINPFDPTIGIDWVFPREKLILSKKDDAAPFLSVLSQNFKLPLYRNIIRLKRDWN